MKFTSCCGFTSAGAPGAESRGWGGFMLRGPASAFLLIWPQCGLRHAGPSTTGMQHWPSLGIVADDVQGAGRQGRDAKVNFLEADYAVHRETFQRNKHHHDS